MKRWINFQRFSEFLETNHPGGREHKICPALDGEEDRLARHKKIPLQTALTTTCLGTAYRTAHLLKCYGEENFLYFILRTENFCILENLHFSDQREVGGEAVHADFLGRRSGLRRVDDQGI